MRLRSLLAVAPVAFVALVGSIGAQRTIALAAPSDEPAAITSVSFRDHFLRRGREIFRFDTFGDEQFWTGFLRMQEPLSTLSPEDALGVGLKVDSDALPRAVVEAIKAGRTDLVDLTDPAVTLTLLRANAVVGVKGTVSEAGVLTSVGITCALCHSTVDDSVVPGVGRRLDGWANSDLNVGAIVALSPAPEIDDATKAEFNTWGPGKYDARHHYFNGTTLVPIQPPGTPSLPVVIPPIFGLQGVGFETYTADGPISYWNAYVGIGQMGGHGTFRDPRIPPNGVFIFQQPDLVTPKLPALLIYQLSLRTPKPPRGSFDPFAAARGRRLFRGEAGCARCHQGRTFTDVLSGPPRRWPVLHEPDEVGTEPEYASRTVTKKYRTTPLRGLLTHPPYFHDGSAADLPAVVEHYDDHFSLNLSDDQKRDLVEFLKSL